MNLGRVKTVYLKEMADILRDRRTVIATIVVPVVLYPLLILFSIQTVSTQTGEASVSKVVVGFASSEEAELFDQVLTHERLYLENREQLEPESFAPSWEVTAPSPAAEDSSGAASQADPEPPRRTGPRPLGDNILAFVLPEGVSLQDAVISGEIACGIHVEVSGPPEDQIALHLLYQPESLRSQAAADRVSIAARRAGRFVTLQRLRAMHVDPLAIEPVIIDRQTLSTYGSMLGLILPLLLVLLTVTAAIYPAIDLTAGEHERNTLETLMVCPVPVMELITGKFLTVTTIAMLGAALNLASVTATIFLGGFGQALGLESSGAGGRFPIAAIPTILLSLVPFSVLASAVLVAVCGCARSFKEAQNYVTPVIIAVLVPGMAASMPGAELTGAMLVMPVGNMVLLTRELLGGAPIPVSTVLLVLLSTCLYAGAAVAVAAQLYGQEAVTFADSVSLRGLLSRHLVRPSKMPTMAMAALYTALLFPLWFYVQTTIQRSVGGNMFGMLAFTALALPIFFIALPVVVLRYWKVDLVSSLQLRLPRWNDWAAGLIAGLAMWIIGHEVFVLQDWLMPTPQHILDQQAKMAEDLQGQPLLLLLILVAVAPALSEEVLFRGMLQSGLKMSLRKWPTLLCVAATFGVFHFLVHKFATTFVLGLVLAWLVWQSRSLWPAVLAHLLNNGLAIYSLHHPQWRQALGIDTAGDQITHLPPLVIVGGLVLMVLAWWLARKESDLAYSSADEGPSAPAA